jgi:hypothetical protein
MNYARQTASLQRIHINRWTCAAVFLATALFFFLQPSVANAFAIYTVGADGACGFSDVQAAVNAAGANPGEDYVWIANNKTYSNQQISVQNQDVIIEGGFTSCSDFTIGASDSTTLRGATSGGPIFAIGGTSNVTINNLVLTGAKRDSGDEGGAIFFTGSGSLSLFNASLTLNHAGYGAAIDMSPTGSATLTLGSNINIILNTADTSGGGIRIEGDTHLIAVSDQTDIGFNTATSGYGGGIEIIGPAYADIGSPGYGFGSGGVINNNTAAYGGGIALTANQAQSNDAIARIFTTVAERPVNIQDNAATIEGGAVYAKPFQGALSFSHAQFCAENFRLDGNVAPEGAAIYLDFDSSVLGGDNGGNAELNLNSDSVFSDGVCAKHRETDFGSVVCAADAPCNELSGNKAQDSADIPTNGSVILATSYSIAAAQQISVRNNSAAHAIAGNGNGDVAQVFLSESLIANNSFLQELFFLEDASGFFYNCTITANVSAANHVFNLNSSFLNLHDVIVSQAGQLALVQTGSNSLAIDNVLSNDITTLPASATTISQDPMFVDPANGNYHLSAYLQNGGLHASRAIDFAATVLNSPNGIDDNPNDLDGNPYGQDVPAVPDFHGTRDLGAYEARPITDRIFGDAFGDRLSILL